MTTEILTRRRLNTSKNLRVRATFLWDGFVRGAWEVERKKQTATLHLTPWEALSASAANDLAKEGNALLRFMEEDATTFEVRMGTPLTSE